jgi:hypothetical protein
MVVGTAAGLALVGCGSSGEAAPPSTAPAVDCAKTRTAMEGYSEALAELAASLGAGDAMSAVAAADAISFSMFELEAALPGMPAEGQAFLASSREVAVQVKESVAQSPQMTGLLAELTTAFADPAFAEGGEAIDAYADEVCPEASPSANTDGG